MRRKFIFIVSFLLICSVFFSGLPAQTSSDTTQLRKLIHYISELEFQAALTDYVSQLFVQYGMESLPRERFLISLMRLVNKEMRERITNPRAASEKYFEDLKRFLDELQQLKQRLRTAKISELDAFINELQARVKFTMRQEELDYKKKKVFEDALQLLYVAEETIKLDRTRDSANLNRKISSSKDRLLSAFGEVGDVKAEPLDVAPNIFNLFEEWRETDITQYNARLLDVKFARSNLIKSGSLENVSRMFNDQLRSAYTAFNYNNYDLADRLLEDLITTYQKVGVKDFEDVYFYQAESNFALRRFMRAQDLYKTLLQQYPNSVYLTRIYSRMVQIAHKWNEPDKVLDYYSRYQNVASTNEKDYFDIQFIAALTLYKQQDFNRAIDIFLSFPKDNPYYYLAQYLTGTAYAAAQNYELATEVFQQLALPKDAPLDIYSRSLYKLALINYEQGRYLTAIEYLSFIPETFSRYDKVLNALAWASFKFEQNRVTATEQPDYSQAKQFAHRLIDEYYASEHRMEAESLLAYIYQLEKKPSVALNMYQNVYQSKVKKKDVGEYLEERDELETLLDQARKMEEKAMRENAPRAYVKASDLANSLRDNIWEIDLAELSPVGSAVAQEINSILDQMEQLKAMKSRAEQEGNKPAVGRIDSTLTRLTAVLDLFPEKYLREMAAYNRFDAYPVSRKVAEYEFRSHKNKELRQNILAEVQTIDSRLATLRQWVQREELKGNYRAVVSLEHQINKLLEVRKDYDRLYTATFDLTPGSRYQEFDKWGDFGAFGIIDVNFGQWNRLQDRLAEVSTLYNSIVDVLDQRREVVEDKLNKIEAEIRFMTMKARLEERKRQRAERERAFRETYFDQRTSEFEEK